MPLFVTTNAQEVRVGADLAHIVGTDNGSLGVPVGGGGARSLVTYGHAQSSFAKDRINVLVNSTPNNDVVITGVDSTFILQGGVFAGSPLDGRPITDVGGGIVAIRIPDDLNPAGTGVPTGTVVPVICDTGGCNGTGYCVPGTGGTAVADPTEVILFHELAHAFQMVTNALDVNNIEPPARADENQLRAELSPALPARSTTSNANPGCGVCGTGSGPKCLIVTAAYGTPRAAEVRALQLLRDTVFRRSVFGDAFFAQLLNEYYRFSPQVAAEMDASPQLRAQIRRILVEPLLDFLQIAEGYVRDGWRDNAAFEADVTTALRATRARFGTTQAMPWPAAEIHTGLEQLRERLLAVGPTPPPPRAVARALAGELHAVLEYLAWVILAARSPTATVRWALLMPLTLYWSALAQHETAEPAPATAAAQLIEAIRAWLGSTPIPTELEYASARELRDDLELLMQVAFAPPGVRQQLGRRLLAALAGRVPSDLRGTLQRADYLPPALPGEGD